MPMMNVCGEQVEVESVHGGFARGTDGQCAFCHGDPCAEWSEPNTPIYRYMRDADGRYRPGRSTCPCCDGRPS
jgi:hypothetical protein